LTGQKLRTQVVHILGDQWFKQHFPPGQHKEILGSPEHWVPFKFNSIYLLLVEHLIQYFI
jgi:hypothetical protein